MTAEDLATMPDNGKRHELIKIVDAPYTNGYPIFWTEFTTWDDFKSVIEAKGFLAIMFWVHERRDK